MTYTGVLYYLPGSVECERAKAFVEEHHPRMVIVAADARTMAALHRDFNISSLPVAMGEGWMIEGADHIINLMEDD